MKTILIPMTDYVLQDNGRVSNINYATKLKLPLKKGYFVHCDENDNILEKQTIFVGSRKSNVNYCNQYNQSKANILFEGFEYDEKVNVIWDDEIYFELDYFNKNRITEQLIAFNLPLTPYGQQFFGL